MNEELNQGWEEAEDQGAGEDSLERSGSESSPAARRPEGGISGAREALAPETQTPDSTPNAEDLAVLSPHADATWPGSSEDLGLEADESDEDAFDEDAALAQALAAQAPEQLSWEEASLKLPKLMPARRRGGLSKKPTKPKTPPLTAEQRLLLLDTWLRSGLPAGDFAGLVGISKHTLYSWKKRFNEHGPAGLVDQPRGSAKGSRVPEVTKRTILMLKEAHPEWGCQRISDMLFRGPALPVSPSTVSRILHEAGYELEEVPTRPHPDKIRRFERAKPNQLWQTDLFTFVLKRQNRRVYLVAFLDDHSRFITSYGLHASQSTALVIEVLRAALAACGVPEEILTDNGSQYVTWRGKSQFTRELEKRGIKQIVAKPRRPQTLGKIERFWGTLWRECLESAIFQDLEDARRRIGLFVDYYNFQRVHRGIDGMVPADRFFGAASEVLATLKKRVAQNALELARHGVPKQPFYLTGQLDGKPFSVHREGDRVVLRRAGGEREDIELKRPPENPGGENPPSQEELPQALCADGSPVSDFQVPDADLPPGGSALDEGLQSIQKAFQQPDSEEQDLAVEEQEPAVDQIEDQPSKDQQDMPDNSSFQGGDV